MAYRKSNRKTRRTYSRKRTGGRGSPRRRSVSRSRKSAKRTLKRARPQIIKVVIEGTAANAVSRPDTLVPMAESRRPRKAKF